MKTPDIPANEAERLRELRAYQILDTGPEEAFEDIVRIAAHVMRVPIALVSLVDEERQWFKAHFGLDVSEAPRALSFCGHAVASGEMLVVEDSAQDERFCDNPLVTGEPYVSFYAGAPLICRTGVVLGTLCAIDHVPRQPTSDQLAILQALSRRVMSELELRAENLRRMSELDSLRQREQRLAEEIGLLERLHAITSRDVTLDDKVHELLQLGLDAFGMDVAVASRVEDGCCQVTHAVSRDGTAPAPGASFDTRLTFCAFTLEANGPVGFHQASVEIPEHPSHKFLGSECYLGTPLFIAGERFGTVNFTARAAREQPFLPREYSLINLIASWLGHELARDRVQRMKSEFVSIASHELRTPLTSIRGSLGLVLGGAAGAVNDSTEKMLRIAYNNTERLVRLINDMLDIDKIESGKLKLAQEPVDLGALVDASIDANRSLALESGVRFERTAGSEGACVRGDADRLLQVVDNLLSNAAKYAPNSGDVLVSIQRRASAWRVSIDDSGPGIPEAFRGHVFSRFAQADATTTRRAAGTGLGLSITKAIVELHGGTMGFSSTPGRGTSFWFELRALDEGGSTGGPRVLVVESDAEVALVISSMLSERGFEHDVAYDAASARALLTEFLYDLITVDLALPDEDGLSLLRWLRTLPDGELLPAVVVSRGARVGQEPLTGDALGIVDWLQKPIDADRLVRALERATGDCERPVVLHVEDDDDLATIIAARLESLAVVKSARTLREAKRLLAVQRFDVAVIDLVLPDGDGRELVRWLTDQPIPTPVVVFSGDDPDEELDGLVSSFLVKSRNTDSDVLHAVGELVDRLSGRASPNSQRR